MFNLNKMRQESEIEKLVDLTSKLSPVPDFAQFEISSWAGWKEYRVVDGSMRSENIFNCADAAICKTTLTKGALLEEHIHPNSTELLVVLQGQLKLIVENRIHTLNKHDHIKNR